MEPSGGIDPRIERIRETDGAVPWNAPSRASTSARKSVARYAGTARPTRTLGPSARQLRFPVHKVRDRRGDRAWAAADPQPSARPSSPVARGPDDPDGDPVKHGGGASDQPLGPSRSAAPAARGRRAGAPRQGAARRAGPRGPRNRWCSAANPWSTSLVRRCTSSCSCSELTSIQVNDSARNCGVVEVGAGGYAVQQGWLVRGDDQCLQPELVDEGLLVEVPTTVTIPASPTVMTSIPAGRRPSRRLRHPQEHAGVRAAHAPRHDHPVAVRADLLDLEPQVRECAGEGRDVPDQRLAADWCGQSGIEVAPVGSEGRGNPQRRPARSRPRGTPAPRPSR
jgi:hypothetical protein